ncbi:hypothetical protein, partial [Microvirga sp. BSC39]|uniref:hypothetical protein n=1 Tax=Microvirga sp. BSC39 TaxID=1549810 RepID=UPI0005659EBD
LLLLELQNKRIEELESRLANLEQETNKMHKIFLRGLSDQGESISQMDATMKESLITFAEKLDSILQ